MLQADRTIHPASGDAGGAASAESAANRRFILTVQCADRPRLVSTVTTCLAESGANLHEAQQFDDQLSGRFFMRIAFTLPGDGAADSLEVNLKDVGDRLGLTYTLRRESELKRVLLLASRFDHCLAELMYRWKTKDLVFNPVGIVSNHPREVYAHLDFAGVPFHFLPVRKGEKASQEGQLRELIEATQPDLVVLARYMQVLSDDMARYLAGRCINIHHSFLPGFKGAKPYHQAHARGVKLIGATAHFVTADLDEGPIIEQDVQRISHRDTPDDLVRKGRDIERSVLARALRAFVEDRILLNGHTTVVFPG